MVWQFTLNANNSNARAFAVKRISFGELLARRAIVYYESSKSPARCFTREPHSELRIDNAARKEKGLGRIKVAGVLEEERPPLGKEDLEALVDSHLRLIGFNLAEVRIRRDVEGEGVMKHNLRIDAAAKVGVCLDLWNGRVEKARASKKAVRNNLNVATG